MLVHSIFESISGEAGFFFQGTWCTFIRLQGCNLRCHYCDTPEAQKISTAGQNMFIKEILFECQKLKNRHILITGGEPLFRNQVELFALIAELVHQDYLVQIETNGSLNLPERYPVPRDKVFWVIDRKGPSSGMSGKMLAPLALNNQFKINSGILKYVISHKIDLAYAINDMKSFPDEDYFLLSPVDGKGKYINWIVKNLPDDLRNKVVFSVQLHKILQLP